VILMNYPKQIKAFYMRLNDPGTDGAPGDTVAAMDVLVPGIGEIIGGSQREERLDVLDRASRRWACPRRSTGGTATSAATAPSPTRASAWASSA
jgi:aspartyl/asparaginyl-tRNA synthetase